MGTVYEVRVSTSATAARRRSAGTEASSHARRPRLSSRLHPIGSMPAIPPPNWVRRYWIEEIDTTGLFEVPRPPKPRARFTTRVERTTTEHHWTQVRVDILDGDTVVAGYDRNYKMLSTFEPSRQGDRYFALISPHYTATSVTDLGTGLRGSDAARRSTRSPARGSS